MFTSKLFSVCSLKSRNCEVELELTMEKLYHGQILMVKNADVYGK